MVFQPLNKKTVIHICSHQEKNQYLLHIQFNISFKFSRYAYQQKMSDFYLSWLIRKKRRSFNTFLNSNTEKAKITYKVKIKTCKKV